MTITNKTAIRISLAAALLLLAVVIFSALQPAMGVCGNLDPTYQPIIAFELARSVADLHAIFGDAHGTCREALTAKFAFLNSGDNFLFIPLYGVFLVFFLLVCVPHGLRTQARSSSSSPAVPITSKTPASPVSPPTRTSTAPRFRSSLGPPAQNGWASHSQALLAASSSRIAADGAGSWQACVCRRGAGRVGDHRPTHLRPLRLQRRHDKLGGLPDCRPDFCDPASRTSLNAKHPVIQIRCALVALVAVPIVTGG